jgi:hypothetical protein
MSDDLLGNPDYKRRPGIADASRFCSWVEEARFVPDLAFRMPNC